jgi:hypothetical protein
MLTASRGVARLSRRAVNGAKNTTAFFSTRASPLSYISYQQQRGAVRPPRSLPYQPGLAPFHSHKLRIFFINSLRF